MSSDKILIVDDESKMRMLLRRCLEGDGFDVIEAEDEAGTLNAIHSHNVQLVTLDLQLGREMMLLIGLLVLNLGQTTTSPNHFMSVKFWLVCAPS
jgi:DNA-binding response OmpR family regulator